MEEHTRGLKNVRMHTHEWSPSSRPVHVLKSHPRALSQLDFHHLSLTPRGFEVVHEKQQRWGKPVLSSSMHPEQDDGYDTSIYYKGLKKKDEKDTNQEKGRKSSEIYCEGKSNLYYNLPNVPKLERSCSLNLETWNTKKKKHDRLRVLTPTCPDSPSPSPQYSSPRRRFHTRSSSSLKNQSPTTSSRAQTSVESLEGMSMSANSNYSLASTTSDDSLEGIPLPPQLLRQNSGRELRMQRVRRAISETPKKGRFSPTEPLRLSSTQFNSAWENAAAKSVSSSLETTTPTKSEESSTKREESSKKIKTTTPTKCEATTPTETDTVPVRYDFSLWKKAPPRQELSQDSLIFPSKNNAFEEEHAHNNVISPKTPLQSKHYKTPVRNPLKIHPSCIPTQVTSPKFKKMSTPQYCTSPPPHRSPLLKPALSSTASLQDRRMARDELKKSFHNPGFQWKIGELLGEGTFGKVFTGLNSGTGELFAAKQIEVPWDKNGESHTSTFAKLDEEITLMKELNHKHIVRYHGTDLCDEYFYILMEYVPGGSISSMLSTFGVFQEDLIRRYTKQILLGVEYLHSRDIVHRDIKGANVLVNEQGIAKLADFGCSKQIHSQKSHSLEKSLRSIRGSVPWMSPEVIKQTGHDVKADIWSIGATVIEMASAKHPWPAFTNNISVMFQIATTTTTPPIPDHLSPVAHDFLAKCFIIDPKQRATATELLTHPFLQI